LSVHPIYNPAVVERRRRRIVDGKPLTQFANLYFQPTNAMLYQVIAREALRLVNSGSLIHLSPLLTTEVWRRAASQFAILAVDKKVLRLKGGKVTDGNAASDKTRIYDASRIDSVLEEVGNFLESNTWNNEDDSKWRRMAEVLVPDCVPPHYIREVYVATHEAVRQLSESVPRNLIPQPSLFFLPLRAVKLGDTNIILVEGDMFFSRMQTLTISVNCVGVMGAGLASRAKWQFPRLYVEYQKMCKERKLDLGRPQLVKMEKSLSETLLDDVGALNGTLPGTWFLLFPTKRHFKERASIHGIKRGLEYVADHYEEWGIESLAVPALGCGLGWLSWAHVGPLICSILKRLTIPIEVYLPLEPHQKVPDEQMTPEFLLKPPLLT